MNAKKILIEFFFAVAIIAFSLVFLFGNFYNLMFSEGFRKNEFNKNNIYSRVPNADNVSSELFDYLKSGSGIIKSDAYTEKEKSHLVDVRVLIQRFIFLFKIFLISLLALLLLIFLFAKKRFLYKISLIMLFGSGLALFTTLLFAILLLSFESSFVKFHQLFFENLNWMLEPDMILIKMFPQQFFYDFSIRFFVQSMSVSFVLLLAGLLGYFYFRKI